jgi:hypothetical protein
MAAETNGLRGRACFDRNRGQLSYAFGDEGYLETDWNIYRAAEFTRQKGWEVVENSYEALIGTAPAPLRCENAALYAGWYSLLQYNDAFSWAEGAIDSTPRPKLKADKPGGTIELDTETVLQGVPAAAWEYKLGNRSALEWILDQYKEKKPQDATIAEHFNTYRFADYKEAVVDLLRRVCTVSVKTVEITGQMPD